MFRLATSRLLTQAAPVSSRTALPLLATHALPLQQHIGTSMPLLQAFSFATTPKSDAEGGAKAKKTTVRKARASKAVGDSTTKKRSKLAVEGAAETPFMPSTPAKETKKEPAAAEAAPFDQAAATPEPDQQTEAKTEPESQEPVLKAKTATKTTKKTKIVRTKKSPENKEDFERDMLGDDWSEVARGLRAVEDDETRIARLEFEQ